MSLDQIEEQKFVELKAMCKALGVSPPPDIFIGLKVHDRTGVLTVDDHQRGHSWLRNYWNMMLCRLIGSEGYYGGANDAFTTGAYGAGYIALKAPNDALVSDWPSNVGMPFGTAGKNIASQGSTVQGVVVGTDDTAFSSEGYKLGALVAHGTGAGQLSHAANSSRGWTYIPETTTWAITMSRAFTNSSGDAILVKESGLYGAWGIYSNSLALERTVLSPSVSVPDGSTLTVTYTISMDFSAIDAA